MVNNYDQFSEDYPDWTKWCNMQAHIDGMPAVERQQEKVVTPNFLFKNSQGVRSRDGFSQNHRHQGAGPAYVQPSFTDLCNQNGFKHPPQQIEWHQSLTPANPWENQPRHGNCILVPVYCYVYCGGTTYPRSGCQNNSY